MKPVRLPMLVLTVAVLGGATASCSDEDAADDAADAGETWDEGGGDDGGAPDADGDAVEADAEADAADGDAVVPGGAFRHGINAGYLNPSFTDRDSAQLAAAAGCDSMRIKLPEYHLDRWGWEIEVGDNEFYQSVGLRDHVAFLVGPTREHSTAPTTAADWELDRWAPRNLHEPIWLPDGSVNPDNYWAAYVHRTVEIYRPYVRIWEVWNEPDQVGGNWAATREWASRPPAADELLWWNASIYDYVRLLRVTKEVVARVDPTAAVATGGIGYETFLDALVRYTDNPVDGSVDAEHPSTGAAWFDVVSYHYYPNWTPGSSDAGADGLLASRARFQEVLDTRGVAGKTYVVTELGASHRAFDEVPSGPEYARNFLLKAMLLGQSAGLLGIDWFSLGDGRPSAEATEPFQTMGLYENYAALARVEDAVRLETGTAYATLGAALRGAVFDEAATAALALPAGARGLAFERPDGTRVLALWAAAAGTEVAAAEVDVATDGALECRAWDHATTGAVRRLETAGGAVRVSLGATPELCFVVE